MGPTLLYSNQLLVFLHLTSSKKCHREVNSQDLAILIGINNDSYIEISMIFLHRVMYSLSTKDNTNSVIYMDHSGVHCPLSECFHSVSEQLGYLRLMGAGNEIPHP